MKKLKRFFRKLFLLFYSSNKDIRNRYTNGYYKILQILIVCIFILSCDKKIDYIKKTAINQSGEIVRIDTGLKIGINEHIEISIYEELFLRENYKVYDDLDLNSLYILNKFKEGVIDNTDK